MARLSSCMSWINTPWSPRPISLVATFFAFSSLLSATASQAASCKNDGGLLYLGNNKSDSRSIWVSGTIAGSYRLEAAQGNTTVDTWSLNRSGLHLSISPFVSSGNGGTHRLFSQGGGPDCLIDTQNQKRDFQLPDNIKPPSLVKPPIGNWFGNFARPLPPVVVIPPGGVFPSAPGGITPPIGTLPPSGVTPGRPGPITPPSSGVTPPIGTVSPEGVTPTRPGPLFPSFGNATAPVATLPPSGVTPGRPGPITPPSSGVTPPIGTRPPTTTSPVQLPGAVVIRRPDGLITGYCIDPRTPSETEAPNGVAFCTRDQLILAGRLREEDQVPLTPGRDLVEPTAWNGWTSVSGVFVDDTRFDRDFRTLAGTAAFGADRKLNDSMVAGFSVTFEATDTEGFNSNLKIDTQGFEIGPYVAARLSQHWAVDGSLSYGFSSSQSDISVLSGVYYTHEIGTTFGIHGQYEAGSYQIRPELSATYSRVFSSGYDLDGTILGTDVAVPIDGNAASLGTVEFSTEVSRQFALSNGFLIQPYVEAGAVYEYLRPNDGKILNGSLQPVTPSPWSFTLRGGATALLTQNVSLDAKGGYLSFGQNGLDVWEMDMRLAIAF